MKTITIEELLQLDQDTITVLDVRPADAYTRGSVPGAVSIPLAEVEERMEELPKEKPVYVLCHTGEWSVDAVYELEAAGYDAANIEGGYRSFLRKKLSEFVQDENTTGEKQKEIERSIIKKFRKGIWRKFTKGIREYDLIQDGDKIAVCISGGKDSITLLYALGFQSNSVIKICKLIQPFLTILVFFKLLQNLYSFFQAYFLCFIQLI